MSSPVTCHPPSRRARAIEPPIRPEADDVGSPVHGREAYRRPPGGTQAVASARRRTSSAVSGRHDPGGRRRSWIGPILVRTSRVTGMADGLAHPPDLAVAALVDRDAQHPRARLGHLRRRRRAVVELDAVAQPAHRPRRHRTAADRGQVLLVDAVAGVGDAVGQLAVVGQQQQPLGVGVEPADGEHPWLGGDELDDRRPSVGVACGGHHATRLVQQVVDEAGLGADRRTVDLDEVVSGSTRRPSTATSPLTVTRRRRSAPRRPAGCPSRARQGPSAGAHHCVPRPRRPLSAARSLALARSYREIRPPAVTTGQP